MANDMDDLTLAELFFDACQNCIGSAVSPGIDDPFQVTAAGREIERRVSDDGLENHPVLKPYFEAIRSVDTSPADPETPEDAALAGKVIGYLFRTRQTPGVDWDNMP